MKKMKNKPAHTIELNASDAKILEVIRAMRKSGVNILFKYNEGPPLATVLIVDTNHPSFIQEGIPLP